MRGERTGKLPVTRRALVAASALGAASTAGCGGVTERSYEAAPVGLSTENRSALALGERAAESFTVDVDGPVITSAEVTNHVAAYDRGTEVGQAAEAADDAGDGGR